MSSAITIAAVAVAGTAYGAYSAHQAASDQKNAANQAAQTQADMYNQTVARNQPYVDAGDTALNQISTGTAPGGEFNQNFTAADFQEDPGYQFRQAQGLKGVENSGAARGMTLSGAQLKGVDEYNQGFASNEYNNAYQRWSTDLSNRFSRLSSIAGLGQASANGTAAAGAGAANQISSAQIGAGNAAAAGAVGSANAITGGINSIGNYYQNQQLLNRFGNNSSYVSPSAYNSLNAAANNGTYGAGNASQYIPAYNVQAPDYNYTPPATTYDTGIYS